MDLRGAGDVFLISLTAGGTGLNLTAGTIEERIQELHGTKRALADSVLAGTGSASPDAEALLALLRE